MNPGKKNVGAANQYVAQGKKTLTQIEDDTRDLKAFKHVKLVVAEITKIDPLNNEIHVAADESNGYHDEDQSNRFSYDELVLALGVESVADLAPGLKEAAYDICKLGRGKRADKNFCQVWLQSSYTSFTHQL